MSRLSAKEESMTAVYDWLGSYSIHPEFFKLSRTALDSSRRIEVSPSDRVEKHQDCILYMNEQEEPVQISAEDSQVSFKGFGHMDSSDSNDTLPYDGNCFVIAPVDEIVPSQLLEGDRYGWFSNTLNFTLNKFMFANLAKPASLNFKKEAKLFKLRENKLSAE